MKMTCRFCGYAWESRKPNPIACPLCKNYFIVRPSTRRPKDNKPAEQGQQPDPILPIEPQAQPITYQRPKVTFTRPEVE